MKKTFILANKSRACFFPLNGILTNSNIKPEILEFEPVAESYMVYSILEKHMNEPGRWESVPEGYLFREKYFLKEFSGQWPSGKSRVTYETPGKNSQKITFQGPHVNHGTPFAFDSDRMIVARDSGEDACYSLNLINWRTGQVIKMLEFPSDPHYIEVEWPRTYFWESSTICWLGF